ncbi:MAG TPA: hypothetical protein VFE52_10360 [Devosia sp.]|jgi:hypothetical protein|nr:hypothetical protein [Devosia sp.]
MALFTMLSAGLFAYAAEPGERLTALDLPLGAQADELPAAEFRAFACGSNGGPPTLRLDGFTAFAQCPAGREGLHEVYFEYSDKIEQAARAAEDYPAGWWAGTQFDHFPVIASALFEPGGRLAGVRLVTDPRPEQRQDPFLRFRPRGEHYLMRLHLMDALGLDPSGCRELPMRDGETPVLGMFERIECEWTLNDRLVRIESTFVRRAGQHDVDPATGQVTKGEFTSLTRAEFRAVP